MEQGVLKNFPPLKDLQRWFNWAVTDNTGDDPVSGCRDLIEGRTSIYQNAYIIRIVEALQDDFKVLNRAMSAELFSNLVERYLKDYPSTYFNISDVGKHLGCFLRNTEYEKELPFFAELADLEWALIEVFWADDTPPIKSATFSGKSEYEISEVHLLLHPSVRLLQFTHAIAQVYNAFDQCDGDFYKPPEKGHFKLLVYREDHIAKFSEITAPEFKLLSTLQNPVTLVELSTTAEALEFTPAQMTESFSRWVSLGLIYKPL